MNVTCKWKWNIIHIFYCLLCTTHLLKALSSDMYDSRYHCDFVTTMLSWSLKNYQAGREAPKQENMRFLFQAFFNINITSNRVLVAGQKLAICEKKKCDRPFTGLRSTVAGFFKTSPTNLVRGASQYLCCSYCLTCFQYQSYLFTSLNLKCNG